MGNEQKALELIAVDKNGRIISGGNYRGGTPLGNPIIIPMYGGTTPEEELDSKIAAKSPQGANAYTLSNAFELKRLKDGASRLDFLMAEMVGADTSPFKETTNVLYAVQYYRI
ncbi:MAG: hypothetical protein AABX47_08690 [Nanoarchaeota archaeon]